MVRRKPESVPRWEIVEKEILNTIWDVDDVKRFFSLFQPV